MSEPQTKVQYFTMYKDGQRPRNVTPIDKPAWVAEGWKQGEQLSAREVFDAGSTVVDQPPVDKTPKPISSPDGKHVSNDGGVTWQLVNAEDGDGDGDQGGGNVSPVQGDLLEDARAKITKLNDVDALKAIVGYDTRKGAREAAAARLKELEG